MKRNIWRAVIEVSFIVFLFYSNLLMGEYERSGMGEKRGLTWAMADVFTISNFGIALIAALIGYALFEFLRKRFWLATHRGHCEAETPVILHRSVVWHISEGLRGQSRNKKVAAPSVYKTSQFAETIEGRKEDAGRDGVPQFLKLSEIWQKTTRSELVKVNSNGFDRLDKERIHWCAGLRETRRPSPLK
jgi:hypothetical protein